MTSSQHPTDPEDPFDTLLTLEDTLYTEAYSAGVSDGARAGRIEGRIFGLEKGFEKFVAMGTLHGRACVWGSRIPSFQETPISQDNIATSSTTKELSKQIDGKEDEQIVENRETSRTRLILPTLPETQRLTKNISHLHSLTDPLTFSTLNTEEGVADFDDRLKRAGAKAKIIERTLGENEAAGTGFDKSPTQKNGRGVKVAGEERKDSDSMEDFSIAGRRLG